MCMGAAGPGSPGGTAWGGIVALHPFARPVHPQRRLGGEGASQGVAGNTFNRLEECSGLVVRWGFAARRQAGAVLRRFAASQRHLQAGASPVPVMVLLHLMLLIGCCLAKAAC